MSATMLPGLAQRLLERRRKVGTSDAELLAQVIGQRDERAFALIVDRHGGMVWNVCRRILRDQHAAEDAFQATFLVLFREAATIRERATLGCWLHGVALRTALKLRRHQRKIPTTRENLGVEPAAPPCLLDDTAQFLDQELARLPRKYRLPLVLCYLEGQTKEETARRLGWPTGTVSGRLARGKAMLKARLTRRGISVAGGLGAAAVSAVPASALSAVRLAIYSGWVATDVQSLAASVGASLAWSRGLRMMALTVLVFLLGMGGYGVGKACLGWVAPHSHEAAFNDDGTPVSDDNWWLIARGLNDSFAIPPDGARKRPVLHAAELGYVSPNGRYVAYPAKTLGGMPRIVDTQDGRTSVVEVTPSCEPDYSFWSPDSRYFVYESWDNGIPQIERLDVVTRQVTRLTHEPRGADAPRYSSRGHLAYRARRGGDDKHPQSVVLVTKEGKTIWTTPESRYFDLRFSPNGKELAVSRDQELLVHDADTGRMREDFKGAVAVLLACLPGIGLHWRPDGNAIAMITVNMAGRGLDDVTPDHKIGQLIVTPRQGPPTSGNLPAGYGLQGWVLALREWRNEARQAPQASDPRPRVEFWLLGETDRSSLAVSPDGTTTRVVDRRLTQDRVSPNGRYIARIEGQGWPYRLTVAPTDRPTTFRELAPAVFDFVWSPDNHGVARTREDGIVAFDPETGGKKSLVPAATQGRNPQFTRAGQLAYMKLRRREGKLAAYDLVVSTPKGGLDFLVEDKPILGYAFSPDGRWLAYSEVDQVNFMDLATKQVKATFKVDALRRDWYSMGFHELYWRSDSSALATIPSFLGGVQIGQDGRVPVVPGTDHVFIIATDGTGRVFKAPEAFHLFGWTPRPRE